MTLLFADGFGLADFASDWDAVAGSRTAAAGRYSDVGYLALNDWGYGANKLITPSAQVFAGGAYYCTTASDFSGAGWALYGDGGTVKHVQVRASSLTSLTLVNGAGATLATATVPSISGWHYYEISGTIADSGGTVVFKIDGVTYINFTGDTKNGGTSTNIDMVAFRNLSNVAARLDDVYICNSLGSTNNTFLGEVRCESIRSTAAGSSTQLTPSTGVNNWDNVNDVSGDTVYNFSATVGQRDTYAYADPAITTGSIVGVMVRSRMQKSDAGAASMKAAVKSSSTVAYGTTRTLSATATNYQDVWETDPATSAAWTNSGVNALEAGAEVA